jgi:hypothetical protein
MLVARNASEEAQRFQVVYRADGSVGEIRGLAERIRAARLRLDAEEGIGSSPAAESGQYFSGGGRADCFAERVRRAEERWARAEALDGML